MYFKKLEIIGFKSFLNKTILNFEPGITAVVGPNGCGKSNIFDSIRWVLGEQSVKSLRGSEMQDVIFNGTDNKEPLNMAEVTLSFDNSNRVFNVDHHEVAITRRIFRSGESEYLLNKTQVRLKDIIDLLAGTGIGAESYSLVAQGKIDLILSSKPEDRRLVFDEASGITKYKNQKREATRRLEETEQNLLRVNDIVTEVKRQITSLERQATKARRYKEAFEELKVAEVKMALCQKKDLEKQRDEIVALATELEATQAELGRAIEAEQEMINNRQEKLKRFEEGMLAAKNEIMGLKNGIGRDAQRISFDREKIAELVASGEYLKKQEEQVRSRLLLDEEKLASVRNEYESTKHAIEEKSGLARQKDEDLEAINVAVKGALERISAAKRLILDLATKIAATRNEAADINSKQQVYLARKKRLDIERAKVHEEKASAEADLTAITQEVNRLRGELSGIEAQISSIRQELGREAAVLEGINAEISRLEKEKLTLESQKEFLDKLRSKYEDISESMNAVIYVDKLPGQKMSGMVVKVRDYLELSDEDRAYFDPANFKLVGEAKPMDLDTQRIAEQIAAAQARIDELKVQKSAKESRISELNAAAGSKQEESRSLEMAMVNKKAQQESMQEQFNKIKEEEDIIALEVSETEKELSLARNRADELALSFAELEKENRIQEELIVSEQNLISHNTRLREETLMLITQLKTELESLTKRIAADEATLKIVEDTYRQDKESLENILRQGVDALAKSDELQREIKELEAAVAEAESLVQEKEKSLEALEEEYGRFSGEDAGVIKNLEEHRKELDSVKNRIYELQMQNKDIDFKYLGIKERMQQNYKFDLDAAGPGQEEAGLDATAIAQSVEELKKRIDSYGTVNLVAIEEYDELKQRYDFLNKQQADLVAAKESLHEAILKINRTTRKMFLETFENVRQEFRNYFRMLFNGGDAQVYLIDEQDPLESGIEIICRPPGKKLQNVLLLSGGEKSMAAIALIFAIFKVKPSPFCVLDEIDAALDEANVDRFGRMLQEFAKVSQFIVITHNKKTIASAGVMYGITMEESGVSKIVSVKFGENKKVEVREPVSAVQAGSVS